VCQAITNAFAATASDTAAKPDPEQLYTAAVAPLTTVSLNRSGTKATVPVSCSSIWQRSIQTTIALAIRSLTGPPPTLLHFISDKHRKSVLPHTQKDTTAASVKPQFVLPRFALLCAHAANSEACIATNAPLLAAAAARTLVLLVEPPEDATELRHAITDAIVDRLTSNAVLFDAVSSEMARAGSSTATPLSLEDPGASYTGLIDDPSASTSAPSLSSRTLPNLLKAASIILVTSSSRNTPARCRSCGAAARAWLSHILSHLHFLASYSAVRAALMAPGATGSIHALLTCLIEGPGLPARTEVMCLSALSALLAGPASSRMLPGGPAASLLDPSTLLLDQGTCALYVAASRAATTRAMHAHMSWKDNDAAALAAAAWPLTQVAHLRDLLQWGRRGGEELDAVIGMYAGWLKVCICVDLT
jgi:hypothetical protein